MQPPPPAAPRNWVKPPSQPSHNHLDYQIHLPFCTHHLSQTTLFENKSDLKKSPHITIPKRPPLELDIFISNDIRLKRHKKYILPLKQPQTSLVATFTTNSKSSGSTSTTTVTKSQPKSTIPPPTNPNPTPKHSTFVTDKECSPRNTNPTTRQTKIPALMNVNTSFHRFRMRKPYHSSHHSSTISPSLI